MGEPVKYIAMRACFINGEMVSKGDTFFWTGKVPRREVAVPASERPEVKADAPLGGDTKPKAAQAAVKRKAEGLPSKGTAS